VKLKGTHRIGAAAVAFVDQMVRRLSVLVLRLLIAEFEDHNDC